MRRIRDYYNLKKLEHWKRVLDQNYVSWKYMEQEEVGDNTLWEALLLLENDCFPVAIVCCCNEENEKQILGTSLWNSIFSFLNGKRNISTENGDVYFHNLNSMSRTRILNAQIASIWLEE